MGRRMNVFGVLAKYGMTPIDRVARRGINYESSGSSQRKESQVSLIKTIIPTDAKPVKTLIKCSICGSLLRKTRLKKHIMRFHTERQLRVQPQTTNENLRDSSKYTNCTICGCSLRIDRKYSHLRKAHKVNLNGSLI